MDLYKKRIKEFDFYRSKLFSDWKKNDTVVDSAWIKKNSQKVRRRWKKIGDLRLSFFFFFWKLLFTGPGIHALATERENSKKWGIGKDANRGATEKNKDSQKLFHSANQFNAHCHDSIQWGMFGKIGNKQKNHWTGRFAIEGNNCWMMVFFWNRLIGKDLMLTIHLITKIKDGHWSPLEQMEWYWKWCWSLLLFEKQQK